MLFGIFRVAFFYAAPACYNAVMEYYKRYTDVIARFTKKADIIPLAVVWSDGREYPIDKVYSHEQRASQVGGVGICFDCRICGQRRNLFYEEDQHRWFIESEKP